MSKDDIQGGGEGALSGEGVPERQISYSANYGRWLGEKVHVSLLGLYFLILYVLLPVSLSDGTQLPAFWVLGVTGLYSLLYGIRLYRTDIIFLLAIMLIAIASVLFSGEWVGEGDRYKSIALLLFSLLNGVIFLQIMEGVDRTVVGRLLLISFLLILIGSILEVWGGLRGISDTFRMWAFGSEHSIFDVARAHKRDLSLVGFIRPNLFTSETSNVAKGFLVFSSAWLLLDYNARKLAVVLVCNVLMVFVTGSLVMVVSLLIACLIALFLEKDFKSLLGLVVLCIGGVITLFIVMHEEVSSMLARLSVLASSQDASSTVSSVAVRMIYPFITLADVLSENPYFGVGIGGTEAISQYATLQLPLGLAVGNNGLSNLIVYFGLVGVFLLMVSIAWYCIKKGIRDVLLLFFILLGLLQTMGDAWTIRLWAYFFLFVSVMRGRRLSKV